MKIRNVEKVGEVETIREIEFDKGEIEIRFLIDFISFDIKEEYKGNVTGCTAPKEA